MADAKRCDRCGNFYEEQPVRCMKHTDGAITMKLRGNLRVYELYSNAGFYYDLCPECFKKLMKFLDINEVKEGEGDG